jgi:hypothetical protein
VLSKQTGIGVPHISGKQILSFSFPRPPYAEQRAVADRIAELHGGVERLEAGFKARISKLAELKQSILRKAFAGELTGKAEGGEFRADRQRSSKNGMTPSPQPSPNGRGRKKAEVVA